MLLKNVLYDMYLNFRDSLRCMKIICQYLKLKCKVADRLVSAYVNVTIFLCCKGQ